MPLDLSQASLPPPPPPLPQGLHAHTHSHTHTYSRAHSHPSPSLWLHDSESRLLAPTQACAAAEMAYTLGFDDSVAPTVTSEYRSSLAEAIEACFVGRGGDMLIVIQNTVPDSGDMEKDAAFNVVARTVDLIDKAYAAADAKELPNLAGISVVLEGFARSGLQELRGKWDDGESVVLPVMPFTDALPAP